MSDIWKAIKIGFFLLGVCHLCLFAVCCVAGGGVVYVSGQEEFSAAQQAADDAALRVVMKAVK